jgi:hypothetical protein
MSFGIKTGRERAQISKIFLSGSRGTTGVAEPYGDVWKLNQMLVSVSA